MAWLCDSRRAELGIRVISPSVVRVAFSPQSAFFSRASIDRVPATEPPGPFQIHTSREAFNLTTAKLRVAVNRSSGAVSFADVEGRPILAETRGGRSLEPAIVQGEQTYHVRQQWIGQGDESPYGLGQMQLGTIPHGQMRYLPPGRNVAEASLCLTLA